MPAINLRIRFLSLFILLWILGSTTISAQAIQKNEQTHEITIYVMPTLFPINWESPAKLYKTMYSCFIKTALVPDNYLLGHLAVQLNTPLLPKPLLTGMSSAKPSERVDYILKHKIGFSILGASLNGRLETEKELKYKLETYKKRGKLAFINYKINEQAAKRIIRFIESYSKSIDNKPASSSFYGGAFWPRYKNEGAGCTAFGLALLDVANLLGSESKDWLMQVNIPMNIIGGEFNKNKKIKISTIRKTKSWYNGVGEKNVDYIPFQIYDPSIIFQWIMDQRESSNAKFLSFEKDGIPGLDVDCKNVYISEDEPLFIERPVSNIFIKKYFENRSKMFIEY